MRAFVVLTVLILGTIAAFYIVWMNRASEKIISAVLPISVAALVGVFMAVFVFGGQQSTTLDFPAMFVYKSPENLPVSLPFRPVRPSLYLVPKLAKSNPALLRDDDQGATLYHHLLQRAIFDTLCMRYAANWQASIIRFNTSTGNESRFGAAEGADGPVTKISKSEMKRLLAGNRFAEVEGLMASDLTLPPDTSVTIQPPTVSPQLGEVGMITLNNQFVRVTIRTRLSQWGILFGGYRLLLGQADDTNTDLRQVSFQVTIETEFKRLRTGHPDMPKYKHWAEQLSEEIQHEFDEQRIWAKSKEDYAFAKELGLPMPPNVTRPFGVLPAPEER